MRQTDSSQPYSFFAILLSATTLFASSPAPKYKDVFEYSWLFDTKNKIYPMLRIKNAIVRKAYENGYISPNQLVKDQLWHLDHLDDQDMVDRDLFGFSWDLSSQDLVRFLKKSDFRDEHLGVIARIELLERDLASFLSSWQMHHADTPWLADYTSLHNSFERSPNLFNRIVSEYFSIEQERTPLHFKEPDVQKALIPLEWEPGLTAWLIPRGFRYGEERTRSELELVMMRKGFSETLRHHGVPMDVQLKFYEVLGKLVEDPQRLRDPEFTKNIRRRMGTEVFLAFNNFFRGYMRDESRRAIEIIQKWKSSASPAHDLYRKLSSKSCVELLVLPKE